MKNRKPANSRKRHLTPRQKQIIFRRVYLPIIIFVLTLLAAIFVTGVASKAKTYDTEHKYYKSITVSCGETLTDIAMKYSDEHYDSIQDYIKEVAKINNINPDKIKSGNSIVIPYYSDEIK